MLGCLVGVSGLQVGFLFEEGGVLRRGEGVVVTGVFGIGVAGSVSRFDVAAGVVGRAAGDDDGLLEAAVEGVTGALVTGGVHGALAVVAGGVEAVGDVAEFAHAVIGAGEGALEDVGFVVGSDVRGLHHDGALEFSVGELGGGGVGVGVVDVARMLDVRVFLGSRDGSGRGTE